MSEHAPAVAVGGYTLYAAWAGRTGQRVFAADANTPY